MAQKKTNYNKEILFALHRPRTKTGFPLYTKVADYSGSADAYSTQAEQDEIYRRECQSKFNSPTNIRRVFITYKNVTVEYYAKSNVVERSSTRAYDTSIKDVIENIMTNNQRMMEYREEKVINRGAKEPDIYSLCGDVIGVISNPYTCNNIEEIYMDWSVLLCDEVKPYFQNLISDGTIQSFMTGTSKPGEMKNDVMLKYFTAFNSGGAKDIRTRFPRLRIIGLISNLNDVIGAEITLKSKSAFNIHTALNFNTDKESVKREIEFKFPTWYDVVKQSGLLERSSCIISTIQTKLPNTNFIVKDNQYKFDRDILKERVDAYNAQIKNCLREEQYGKGAGEQKGEENKGPKVETAGEIEAELDRIVQQKGINFAQIVLTVATTGMSKTQLEEMFKEFTDTNRSSMAKMLGLNIN